MNFPSEITQLFQSTLHAGGESYRFAELEYYGNDDPFTHRHPRQLLYQQFYVHRASRSATAKPKGGTFMGLDITFGSGDTFCGVLVRGLVRQSDSQLITGPCVCVREIMAQLSLGTPADLVECCEGYDVFSGDNPLFLTQDGHEVTEIYTGPRIGLKNRSSEDHARFADMHYRFVWKKLTKKEKTKLQLAN